MANSHQIGADFFAALSKYAQAVNEAVQVSSKIAVEHIEQSLKESAAASTRWAPVADYIETWSRDGRYIVGVRDLEAVSQAEDAEYGNAENPPVPMFRNMPKAIQGAAEKVDNYLLRSFGSSLMS